MSKPPIDPLRTRLHELTDEINDRLGNLRDFATTPGNAWLAKNELQNVETLLSDLSSLLEEIKQSDRESGY